MLTNQITKWSNYMHIDFTAVDAREKKLADLAKCVTRDDLYIASNESIDRLLALIEALSDADITFVPSDAGADDPYAIQGEEHIGWSLAHLVAHVTASSEEGAAFSSILARGYPLSERPRYETPWKEITTRDQCIQRLEESRRIRNGYLATWPDVPHLDVYRAGMSGRFEEYTGKLNAIGCFLLGLRHEIGHFPQFEEVMGQALAVPVL
jgi:hypothetical protein